MTTNQNAAPANDKVIDKIKKLLALGTDNRGNETERETAMRQALKLLAKHNLEMSDVNADLENKEDREEVHYEEFPDPFRKVVGNAIAELYFCKFYSTKVPGKQKVYFHFVGLESNANVAKELSYFVIRSLYTESQRYQVQHGNVHGIGTTHRNAASQVVARRCKEMRAEAETDKDIIGSQSTALVLASVYDQEAKANEDFLTMMGIKLKQKTVTLANKSAHASAAGREYGKNVNLAAGKQIKG